MGRRPIIPQKQLPEARAIKGKASLPHRAALPRGSRKSAAESIDQNGCPTKGRKESEWNASTEGMHQAGKAEEWTAEKDRPRVQKRPVPRLQRLHRLQKNMPKSQRSFSKEDLRSFRTSRGRSRSLPCAVRSFQGIDPHFQARTGTPLKNYAVRSAKAQEPLA